MISSAFQKDSSGTVEGEEEDQLGDIYNPSKRSGATRKQSSGEGEPGQVLRGRS